MKSEVFIVWQAYILVPSFSFSYFYIFFIVHGLLIRLQLLCMRELQKGSSQSHCRANSFDTVVKSNLLTFFVPLRVCVASIIFNFYFIWPWRNMLVNPSLYALAINPLRIFNDFFYNENVYLFCVIIWRVNRKLLKMVPRTTLFCTFMNI